MSRPPVSKQTPLPTSVTFGASFVAPDHVDQPRRSDGSAADRVDHREILRQEIVALDRPRPWPCVSRQACAPPAPSASGPMSLVGVLTRSRARKTPSATRRTCAASAPAGRRSDVLAGLLAVAGEDIAAEHQAERRKVPDRRVWRQNASRLPARPSPGRRSQATTVRRLARCRTARRQPRRLRRAASSVLPASPENPLAFAQASDGGGEPCRHPDLSFATRWTGRAESSVSSRRVREACAIP